MKPRQLPWKWLLLGLVGLLIAGLVLLPRQIGTPSDVRDRVAAALSAWTGASITLTEPLSLRYFPPLSLRGGMVLTNATELPWVRSITSKDVKVSLSLPALLMGRVEVHSLRLGAPKITLKETAPGAALHGQTPEALIAKSLTATPIDVVRVRGGTIVTASGEDLISDLDARIDTSKDRGAVAAVGFFDVRGETIHFTIDSGAISQSDGEQTAPLTVTVTSDPVTAEFSGIVHTGEGFTLDGDMQVDMSDARHFLRLAGMELPRGQSLKNLSASGPVHWNGTILTFENGTFSLDGNTAVGLLAVTPGERPTLEGTLAFEHLGLDPYLGVEETETVEGPLFGWALLKHFDADLRISASEVSASNIQLGRGGFTVTAKNGAASTEIGELELCGGKVSGRVELDLSASRVKAKLDGNLSHVALKPCFQPFALGVPIEGVGSLKIDVSTGGYTPNGLVRGLVGNFKVSAENGQVPIDLSQISTDSDAEDAGWSSDSATPFETLDADCRLSAGHIWCQSFEMRTPRGLVSGSGGVDVGQLTLDWDFLIANPVAQLSASQLVMEPPPRITISGPLTQPLIQRANRPALDDGTTQSSSGNVPVAPR